MAYRFFLSLVLSGMFLLPCKAQVYLDPSRPLEERVEDLISRLSVFDKISQLTHEADFIFELEIPSYNWWNECLHGVARAGKATVFPQSITVAASFDRDLMYRIGTATSDEARAKYHDFQQKDQRGLFQGLTFWSPNINIFRDPRWGRGHETYGEDPYLTGELATPFIQGLQGKDPHYLKVVATSKHYAVHSGPEAIRHSFDVDVSDVDLHETYLPAFRKTVTEGKVYSIMGAYNRFRGESCCSHDYLLNQILRQTWGFEGYVVSDCGGIANIYKTHKIKDSPQAAAAHGVQNGCDLNCGSVYRSLEKAVAERLITEAEIDRALRRLLTARFRLGMFDPQERVPYTQIPLSVVGCDAHLALAREAAQKSIVLLKNDEGLLPLSKDLKKIAVIGPNADNFEALIGNYHGTSAHPVTLLEGIQNKVSPEIVVSHAAGSHLAHGLHNLSPVPSFYLQTPDGRQGLLGKYYPNTDWEGEPVMVKVDDQVNFWWDNAAPSHQLMDDRFSVRWEGYLLPPEDGEYSLGTWARTAVKVFLEGEQIIDYYGIYHAFHKEHRVTLKKGQRYRIQIDYADHGPNNEVRFLWSRPDGDMLEEAMEKGREADVIILALGLSQRLEGEEMPLEVAGFYKGDRLSLDLPPEQQQLMEKIATLGKPTVLVLMAGSAVAINWADAHLDAVLSAGYPGEQGGNAIADVLFGDYNPAGRLPVTYYRSVDQLPPFEDYNMQGRTYRYFPEKEKPLYPFGFGLSYTTFSYQNLSVPTRIETGQDLSFSVEVVNTGTRDGEEVVQIYLKDLEGSTPRPIHQLVGFERVFLKAGEMKELSFRISARQLSLINPEGIRVIEPGKFLLFAGGKQPGMEGRLDAPTTHTRSAGFLVEGQAVTLPH